MSVLKGGERLRERSMKVFAIGLCVMLSLTAVSLLASPLLHSFHNERYNPNINTFNTLPSSVGEFENIQRVTRPSMTSESVQTSSTGTPHVPIFIDGDEDFKKQAKDEGWSGSGKRNNPYIIENLEIDLGGVDGNCIEIRNILSTYFCIRSCALRGALNEHRAGIYLYNVAHAEVTSNTCNDNYYGIHLERSEFCTVDDNLCTSNEFGICLLVSDLNTVVGNTATGNYYGIKIESSEYNEIIRNECTNNDHGIHLYDSGHNTLIGNVAAGNDRGFHLLGCYYVNMSSNTASNGQRGFYAEDVRFANLTGNAAFNNRYGFYLGYGYGSFSESVLSANIAKDNTYGFYNWGYENNVTSNSAIDNEVAFYLFNCAFSNFEDNFVSGGGGFMVTGYKNRFARNTIKNAGGFSVGIWGEDGGPAVYCTFIENTVEDCGLGFGIIYWSSHNRLENNTVIHNRGGIGVWSDWCEFNIIVGNNITQNYRGIILSSTDSTLIYHNNIIENTIQVSTHYSSDSWYHPELLEGNYWSDYSGVDDGSGTGKHSVAGDGIGDTDIPWPGPEFDLYPFVRPYGWITVEASNVDIDPDTLNLNSKGEWITCYIQLPQPYDVGQIDISSVKLWLNDKSFSASWGDIQYNILSVKFDREAIVSYLEEQGIEGEIAVTVTGDVIHNRFAIGFIGCEMLRVEQ